MPETRYVPTNGASDPREMRWQVAASILGATSLVIFVLLFVAFVATGLTLFQSVAVIVAAILAMGGFFVAMWSSWGALYSRRTP